MCLTVKIAVNFVRWEGQGRQVAKIYCSLDFSCYVVCLYLCLWMSFTLLLLLVRETRALPLMCFPFESSGFVYDYHTQFYTTQVIHNSNTFFCFFSVTFPFCFFVVNHWLCDWIKNSWSLDILRYVFFCSCEYCSQLFCFWHSIQKILSLIWYLFA